MKIDKRDLGYLQVNGQYRVVKKMIESPDFYPRIKSIVKASAFTDINTRTIVEYIIKYYDEKGITPTYKNVEFIIKDKSDTVESVKSLAETLNNIKKEELLNGQEEAVESAINTLKTIESLRICTNELKNLKENGYKEDMAQKYAEERQSMNRTTDVNFIDAEELLNRIFEEDSDNRRIPTGINELDKQLNGGLPCGSVNLLIAGTGVGKTTLSSIIAITSATMHCRVLHIFFEDRKEDIGRKYYASLTGHYTQEYYKTNPNYESLKQEILGNSEMMDILTNYIKPIRMENCETSFADVKNMIQNLITVKGWKPDLVIVDYISCMRTSSNKQTAMNADESRLYERIMRQFEAYSSESDICFLIMQQTNRNANQEKTKGDKMGNIQGSYRMIQPCSTVLYLERAKNTGDFNSINLSLEKCRGCEPREWQNAKLNNGNCQIDLSQVIRTNEELEFDDDDTKYTAHI